jgi:hypothetical protein
MGLEPGVRCDRCDQDDHDAAHALAKLLQDAHAQGPVLQEVAAEFQEEFRMYLCDCHPAGLPVALRNALEKAMVNYITRVSKLK